MNGLIGNILANLRALFQNPEATEAELDQHLEDLVAVQSETEEVENTTDTPPTEAAEQTPHTEEEPQIEANDPMQEILQRLNALEAENQDLRDTIDELKEEPAAGASSYTEEVPQENKSDRYLCPNTRKALGL